MLAIYPSQGSETVPAYGAGYAGSKEGGTAALDR
jgi:hypothetical protein